MEIVVCQVHLADGNKKDGTFVCNKFLNHMKEIDPAKKLSDIFMFDGDSNVQIVGRPLKVHYPKLAFMRVVEHTVLLFLMMFQRYPFENQMIYAHKMILGFSVMVYITSLIPYLNPNLNSFAIETLVFLVETRL